MCCVIATAPCPLFPVHGNLQSPDGVRVEDRHEQTCQTTALQNQPQGQSHMTGHMTDHMMVTWPQDTAHAVDVTVSVNMDGVKVISTDGRVSDVYNIPSVLQGPNFRLFPQTHRSPCHSNLLSLCPYPLSHSYPFAPTFRLSSW